MKTTKSILVLFVTFNLAFTAFLEKIDLKSVRLEKPKDLLVISSANKGVQLIGKFGGYPIFEHNSLGNLFTNCDFCNEANWGSDNTDLYIFDYQWKDQDFFISGLVINGLNSNTTEITISNLLFPVCPNSCSGKGSCFETCDCYEGYIGNQCQNSIGELNFNSKITEKIEKFKWKAFYLDLEKTEIQLEIVFYESTSKGVKVYISPGNRLYEFPGMNSYKYQISFFGNEKLVQKYIFRDNYVLWSFFCDQEEDCEIYMKLESKNHSHKLVFFKIFIFSTVSVFSFIGVFYVSVLIVKKLKLKYCNPDEKKKLINQSKMEKAFPQFESEMDSQETCCICLVRITEQQVRKLLCDHTFHASCIDTWTLFNAYCPLCKSSIRLI